MNIQLMTAQEIEKMKKKLNKCINYLYSTSTFRPMGVVSAFTMESYLRQPAPICVFDFCNVISVEIPKTFGTAGMRTGRTIVKTFLL